MAQKSPQNERCLSLWRQSSSNKLRQRSKRMPWVEPASTRGVGSMLAWEEERRHPLFVLQASVLLSLAVTFALALSRSPLPPPLSRAYVHSYIYMLTCIPAEAPYGGCCSKLGHPFRLCVRLLAEDRYWFLTIASNLTLRLQRHRGCYFCRSLSTLGIGYKSDRSLSARTSLS